MNYNIVACTLFIILIFTLISYISMEKINKENFSTNTGESTNLEPDTVNSQDNSGIINDISDIGSQTELTEMFNKLDMVEGICDDINNRQTKKDLEDETKILELSKEQLDVQQERINQLKDVLNTLREQEIQHELLDNKCQRTNQEIINTDYDVVTQLANQGLLKDQSINVDLNVSDKLKNLNLLRNKKERESSTPETIRTERIPENINELIEGAYSVPPDPNNYVSPEKIKEMYAYCGVDRKEYIDINELQFGVCQGCDKEKIKEKIEKINSDFNSK